jgi:hypothetical protein
MFPSRITLRRTPTPQPLSAVAPRSARSPVPRRRAVFRLKSAGPSDPGKVSRAGSGSGPKNKTIKIGLSGDFPLSGVIDIVKKRIARANMGLFPYPNLSYGAIRDRRFS